MRTRGEAPWEEVGRWAALQSVDLRDLTEPELAYIERVSPRRSVTGAPKVPDRPIVMRQESATPPGSCGLGARRAARLSRPREYVAGDVTTDTPTP